MVLPDGDPQIYNFIWKRTLQLRYGVKIGFQELDWKRTGIGENIILHLGRTFVEFDILEKNFGKNWRRKNLVELLIEKNIKLGTVT